MKLFAFGIGITFKKKNNWIINANAILLKIR